MQKHKIQQFSKFYLSDKKSKPIELKTENSSFNNLEAVSK